MNIREGIGKVVTGENLTEEEMVGVMGDIMGGDATEAQIGSFITALSMKGETVDEIVGAARVMREKATRVNTGVDTAGGEDLFEVVGTGGDCTGTFNVSTCTSFVVAAAGVPVAKHGNRSISSKCGAADVLEALGVNLGLNAEQVGESVRKVGLGFLFAPNLHNAMKYAAGPRKQLGIRTVFNILGPLTNPAGANVQLSGVFDKKLTRPLTEVMVRLGAKRIIFACGEGGIDELTVTGTTWIAEGKDGSVREYSIEPEDLGLGRWSLADIQGGATATESAQILRDVLSGAKGARRDMVLMNAAYGLMMLDRAADPLAGVKLAAELIDSGAALEKVEALAAFSKAQA